MYFGRKRNKISIQRDSDGSLGKLFADRLRAHRSVFDFEQQERKVIKSAVQFREYVNGCALLLPSDSKELLERWRAEGRGVQEVLRSINKALSALPDYTKLLGGVSVALAHDMKTGEPVFVAVHIKYPQKRS